MKIFDHTNPRHLQILKEELVRAKRMLNEEYSADAIWDSMSPEDRKDALTKANATDIDKLVDLDWDSVPADTQDSINLFYYELAKDSREGQIYIRGIRNMVSENPDASKLVSKFLKKVKRNRLEDLNNSQAQKLNIAVSRFIRSTTPGNNATFDINPRDTTGGAPSKNRDWRGGMWTGD
jgi:hypothetical protein